MLSSRLNALVIPTIHDERQQLIDDDRSCDRWRRHEHQQKTRDQHLRDELRERTQPAEIVDDAEQRHQARAQEQRHERRPAIDHREAGDEPGDDRDPAEKRNGPAMPAIVDRNGDVPSADGEGSNGGCRERRDHRTDAERGEDLKQGRRHYKSHCGRRCKTPVFIVHRCPQST